jgi:hypothetical protein
MRAYEQIFSPVSWQRAGRDEECYECGYPFDPYEWLLADEDLELIFCSHGCRTQFIERERRRTCPTTPHRP